MECLKTEFNLPETVKDAIIKKTLSDDTIKEILRIRDPLILSKIAVIIKRKNRYEKNIIKTAQFSEKRRQLMKEKMSEYRKVKSRGLILSSIWDIGKRDNYAGDPQFYGNTPTQVIEQCVIRLTKPNDVILDAMAGSGTTIDVCKVLNRTAIAYDLNPTRSDITKNDSRNIPLGDSTIDMGFLHPPYLNMVKYSDSKEDLSNAPLSDFFSGMKRIISEYYRVLKKNAYLCLLVGDVTKKGKFLPLTRRLANMAEEIGFTDCGYAIKITRGSVSQKMRGNVLYAELLASNNLKVDHDSILFFKKF